MPQLRGTAVQASCLPPLAWACAAGELGAGDAGDDEAGEPSRGDEPGQGLGDEVQRRQQARRCRHQRGDSYRPRQFAGAQAGQSEGAEQDPEGWVWITPPARNSRRTRTAALVSRRPQGPESAAAHAAEAARDAAAREPPAIAAVCNVRDPRPARPASRATAAVNRASETAEMAWPAALSRVGPAFWVKYCRSWLGDAPGRG